ncbi:MAG: hypothetical protein IKZ94_06525, partial [Lachnospiraceae bacterium]|nr:hypothetical protein [Lachnospiraceae bacterium]
MNTRIKALIASGLLFATALPVVACARKAPEAKLLPTAEPSIIETTDTEIEQKAVEINVPVEFQDPIVETVPAESSIMIKESKKQAETKKSTKKETKTTKKTAKKTKKAKKTNKKSDKKSDKKTTAPKFAYGSSSYTAKNIKITVHIKKDNKVEV